MTASSDPIPTQRALIPSVTRLRVPAVSRRPRLSAIVGARALPAISRTASAVAVALAVEYMLRGATNQALSRFVPSMRNTSTGIVRTVVTEVVVIERYRRRP